jgi:diguanylate cyclase (GGDEF)-like protein
MPIKAYYQRLADSIRYEHRDDLNRDHRISHLFYRYGVAVLAVIVAFELKFAFGDVLDPQVPFLLVLSAVIISTFFAGIGPGILTTLLSAIVVSYYYLDPVNSFLGLTKNLKIAVFVLEGLLIVFLNALRIYAERREKESALKIKETREEIVHQSLHDSLTGLPNKTYFERHISKAIAKAKTKNDKLAVLFVDLDHFKKINEGYGHNIGDLVLKESAERIAHSIGNKDFLARLSGDEFIILLSKFDDPDYPKRVAVEVSEALKPAIQMGDTQVHVGTSIGISTYPQDGNDPSVLLRNADTALYKAKEQGRNSYRFYNQTMDLMVKERLMLENDLRYALDLDQFLVYYQPIFNLKEKNTISAEVLLRWLHPKWGLMYPHEFLSLADDLGILVALSEWILRKACQTNVERASKGLPLVKLSINLSARQFSQGEFLDQIPKILEETGMDPKCLQLEITEGAAMQDINFTISRLNSLRDIGVKIALDDFGTGYSSLSYLRRFPIDTLKIDRSFIRACSTDKQTAAIIQAIISMAHSLRMNVVAEGVENKDQLKCLEDMHCDAIQGYLVSYPLAEDTFQRWISEKS